MSDSPARLLPKIITFVSSVSGSDKVFRTALYTLKVLDIYLSNKYGDKSQLIQRIRNFTGPIGDTRMILRLFGMFATIEGVLTNEESDAFLRPLSIVQAWSMVLYYPLDNIYWFALHQIIPMSDETRDACSRVSCQAWLVYIVLDIVAYVYKYIGLRKAELKLLEQSEHSEDNSAKLSSLRVQQSDLTLRTLSALADLCLAVHWSVKVSYFPPLGVGIAGSLSSLIGLYLKWKYTA